ncbi:hypothetical protein [Sphingobacterium suaedae]|uniref:Uncharacterized protein n=1 Tax=Sphingobacterium suaedae TaxID=1686402 RepID=A0ABW5KFH7_9SPHI
MEVNMDLNFLKQFEFATVKYNDQDYLKIYSYPDQLSEMTQISLLEFENKYERELIHIRLILSHSFNLFVSEAINILSNIENDKIIIEKAKDKLFILATSIMDQNQLGYEFITNQVGNFTFLFFQSLIQELLRRIEEIENLFSIIKPYLKVEEHKLIAYESLVNEMDKLESISLNDWKNILLTPVNEIDLIETNVISINRVQDNILNTSNTLKKLSFEDAIRIEAKEDFEHWYKRFCINEPTTEKIDVVLFFKLMNKLGYFRQEYNIHDLYLLTIDRTKIKIAFNTFKNNGRKKFENWMDGKPQIPTFT